MNRSSPEARAARAPASSSSMTDGQGPLGLGHGQAAGRQGRAGHRPAPDGRDLLDRGDPVLLEPAPRSRPARPGRGRPAGSTAGRSAGPGVPYFSKKARRPLTEPQGPVVLDPAVLDGDAQEELAVPLLVPAEVVVDVGHGHRPRVGAAGGRGTPRPWRGRPGRPQSWITYLSRARLRSERLPKSRKTLMHRLADLQDLSRGRRSRAARARNGNVFWRSASSPGRRRRARCSRRSRPSSTIAR